MTQLPSKKINFYLKTDTQDLQLLFAKIKELEELNNKVLPYLPKEIKAYCQVANKVAHQLVFIVANSSVATQIRFQSIELIKEFKKDPALRSIKQIHCKVQSYFQKQSAAELLVKKMAPLSQQTAELIRATAASLTDPKLREIMERIAKHTGEK